jgi:Spy/CpxP family protein refolding chaperone
MKKRFLVLALAMTVSAGATSFAYAEVTPDGVDNSGQAAPQHKEHFKQQFEKKHAAFAKQLGLSSDQQAQIKTIIETTRKANEPLRKAVADNRKKARELAKAAPLDEAALRAAIAGGEAVRTDLAVARIKSQKQINAVLTPEQQEKARQLHKKSPGRQHKWDKVDA